ncbi:hypothetical protein AWW71_27285 [Bacillus cereus]|uniref:hypothetical protein n=1 Tax=Bacillus cereus TaxID=1396 RepID=UPI0007629255|nr:hypothetical protein [Bacillus cereus]KWU69130.1 hypothetical protein AWW71_27285 [Bacillus cereus]
MRHTRNRQMTRIGEENFMEMKNFKISTIRKFDGKFPNRLDPTFKWHRDCYPWGHNWIEFGYGDSHTLVKSK